MPGQPQEECDRREVLPLAGRRVAPGYIQRTLCLSDHCQPPHAVHLFCFWGRPGEYTRSLSMHTLPHARDQCLSCPLPKVSGTMFPGSSVSPLVSCPQDTAEYVAYVAKDPVNQRGEAAAEGAKCQSCFMDV